MATIFRLTAPEGHSIGEADYIDEIIELVRSAAPGSYLIEEVSTDPATGDPRSLIWGAIIKELDGGIKVGPPPWFD